MVTVVRSAHSPFRPTAKPLASGSQDRTVRVWDLASGQERNRLPHLSSAHSASFSSDGKVLVSVAMMGPSSSGSWVSAVAPDILEHGGAVKSVVFSRDGQTLISGGDHPTKLWVCGHRQEKATLPGPIWSGAISEDGSALTAPNPDKTITVWDLSTGQAKTRFQEEKGAAVALSPDGTTLVGFSPTTGPSSFGIRRQDSYGHLSKCMIYPSGPLPFPRMARSWQRAGEIYEGQPLGRGNREGKVNLRAR